MNSSLPTVEHDSTRDWIPTIRTGLLGLCGLIAAVILLSTVAAGLEPKYGALLMMALTALPMLSYDALCLRVFRQPAADLNETPAPADHGRVAVKLTGLAATLALVAFAYWLFPEYHKSFYQPFL